MLTGGETHSYLLESLNNEVPRARKQERCQCQRRHRQPSAKLYAVREAQEADPHEEVHLVAME